MKFIFDNFWSVLERSGSHLAASGSPSVNVKKPNFHIESWQLCLLIPSKYITDQKKNVVASFSVWSQGHFWYKINFGVKNAIIFDQKFSFFSKYTV